jgi:hypothetical protein
MGSGQRFLFLKMRIMPAQTISQIHEYGSDGLSMTAITGILVRP